MTDVDEYMVSVKPVDEADLDAGYTVTVMSENGVVGQGHAPTKADVFPVGAGIVYQDMERLAMDCLQRRARRRIVTLAAMAFVLAVVGLLLVLTTRDTVLSVVGLATITAGLPPAVMALITLNGYRKAWTS